MRKQLFLIIITLSNFAVLESFSQEFISENSLADTDEYSEILNKLNQIIKQQNDQKNDVWTVSWIVGLTTIIAGAMIAGIIHHDNQQKLKKRRDSISLKIVDTILPLRQNVRDFIKFTEKEGEESYRIFPEDKEKKILQYYNNLRDFQQLLNNYVIISGGSIDVNLQLDIQDLSLQLQQKLPRIQIDDHNNPLDFNMVLVHLYGIENIANRILQKMKDYVKKSLEEKNQRINERLRQFNKPRLSKGEKRVKEFWESQKKTNQDYVNDIIEDNAVAKNSETTINNSTGAIVKNGITIYPDGTRVDSHGTIL